MAILVDDTFVIEKFKGKGGWTYILFSNLRSNENAPFGWVNVYGTIDDFTIENYNLQPFGNGQLFLPLNAKLRKTIKKNVGDFVKIQLFETQLSVEEKADIIACFQADENVFTRWKKLSEKAQFKILWSINRAKDADEKAMRIIKFINNHKNDLHPL
jgi:hypothetical protein